MEESFALCPNKGALSGEFPAPMCRNCQEGSDLADARWAPYSNCRVYPLLIHIESAPIEDVTIDSAAAVMRISPSRLRHLFKQCIGESFQKYVIAARLRRARYLLLSSSYTITEIGDRLGIEDMSHFRRDFRRVFGYPPATFRRQMSVQTERR